MLILKLKKNHGFCLKSSWQYLSNKSRISMKQNDNFWHFWPKHLLATSLPLDKTLQDDQFKPNRYSNPNRCQIIAKNRILLIYLICYYVHGIAVTN